ncbi:MAG: sarcosine oxidase subunit delta [Anaerolineae bacterium]|nr:sarcosine oxidase subunit delta [Anaerolineae bacterium]
MILIICPNCGRRNAQEFRYGGEVNPRPKQPLEVKDDAWADYLYMRDNRSGVQKEWWYHQAGCQLWFLAERNTQTNELLRTYLLDWS